jgi:hypothetical protein
MVSRGELSRDGTHWEPDLELTYTKVGCADSAADRLSRAASNPKVRFMAKLIYSMLMSLDGYTQDERGRFGWAPPDEEVHSFINELGSSVGTYLFGRRMYETMVYWETAQISRCDW